MIRTKRAYDIPDASDGERVLVDRLWPRGLTKERASIDRWERELSPSPELRKWYGHEPERYAAFRERYRAELVAHRDTLEALARRGARSTVTLVYAARDSEHCNAGVLKELLDELLARGRS